MDHYKILGIDKNASLDEVHRAYREKAKKYHPDAGGDTWAFQQVHDAYQQILKERGGTATDDFGSKQAEPPKKKSDFFKDGLSAARGGFGHILSRHAVGIAVICTALIFGFFLFQILGDSNDVPATSQVKVQPDATPASTPAAAAKVDAAAADKPADATLTTDVDIFADDTGPAEAEAQPVDTTLGGNEDQPEPEQLAEEVPLAQVDASGIEVAQAEPIDNPVEKLVEDPVEILEPKKPAVPGKDETQETEQQIAELYGERLKQTSKSSEYVELAREMMRLANEPDKPVSKYVLWSKAKDLAADGGDDGLFVDAIESIAAIYDVDPLKMKASAYYRAARADVSRETQASLVQGMFALHDEAVAAERFAIAVPLLEKVALTQAQKARNADLVREVKSRLKSTKKLQRDHEAAQIAAKALQVNPDDPEANLQYGSFLCLVKGDWSRGLVYLTKSGDTALASAADLELAAAGDAEGQIKIAEAWLAAGNSEVKHRLFLARAAWWYEKSLPGATGLKQVLVQKRLTELKGQLADIAELRQMFHVELQPARAPFDPKKAAELQQAWAQHLGVPVEINNAIGMQFVLIPPGEFTMGYNEPNTYYFPMHRVRLTRPFYIGKFELTVDQNASLQQRRLIRNVDARPQNLSWVGAVAFCKTLNEFDPGKKYRLPTEAEWEYAHRAGRDDLPDARQQHLALHSGWYKANSNGTFHPVGQKPPNPWGLYDTFGNANEWVQEYCFVFPPADLRIDPGGPKTWSEALAGYRQKKLDLPHGPRRIVKGGSFKNELIEGGVKWHRFTNRHSGFENKDYGSSGARLVLEIDK